MTIRHHQASQIRIPHHPRDLLLIAVLSIVVLVLVLAVLSGIDLLGQIRSMPSSGWLQVAAIILAICAYFLLVHRNRVLEIENTALVEDIRQERNVVREKLDRLDASLNRLQEDSRDTTRQT